MKNSNYKLLKVTLIVVLFMLSSKSYSQEKFHNKKLFELEKIAFNTNKLKTLQKNMEELNYIFYSQNGNFVEFRNESGDRVWLFINKKRIDNVSLLNIKAEDVEDIVANLKENNFIEVQEDRGKRYKKKTYPFSLFIQDCTNGRTLLTAYKI